MATRDPSPIRFSLDSSLGQLARWLRLLGHDAAWERGDDLSAAIARARSEERFLLTRSRDLHRLGLSWPPLGGLVISSDDVVDQLVEVAVSWPVFQDATVLSRCAECNTPLAPMDTAEARRLVPPFVARTQGTFHVCSRCRRVYWTGTHAGAIQAKLERAASRSGQPFPH